MNPTMTSSDFTVTLFCRIDDVLKDQKKHPLAELYPSEVVTLGMLQALRGEGNRAFYRWVQKELMSLFPKLPERTRLFRLLVQFEPLCQQFLAQSTFFGVADSYGIELVHPWRERRTQRAVARKGLSNHRWIVGAKLVVVLNDSGQISDFAVAGANTHDTAFHPLIAHWEQQMIVLADQGFKAKQDNPANLKICGKGEWNERMIVETVFSLFTVVLKMKKLTHRLLAPLQARLAYTCAVFNLCTAWDGDIKLQLAPFAL
jgi:hypothetical protein